MKNQNPTTTIKRLVQSVAVLDGLMLLTGGILIFRFYAYITDGGTSLVLSIVFSLFAITYCALGMLILSRHSRHTIGWLFLMVSFSAALQILLNGLGGLALGLPIQSKWVRASLQLVGDFIWPLWLFTPFTLGLLYFPDGHLPSRRWWPFAALAILNIAAFSVFQLIIPWAPETIHRIGMDNPFVIAGSEEYFPFFAGIPNVINALGALAASIMHYRRANNIERTQMKWPFYLALIFLIPLFTLPFPETIAGLILGAFLLLFPISIGIAILRYRLMDIDLIIRRTLQYSLLTGMLVLTYFGSVILIQFIFRSLTGNTDSPLITVISTLAIAALFNPLRYRIQNFIDRRFYRRKYDAEKALAKFAAAAARDEVDMEKLTDALLGVVEETMQPEKVSLWLKPTLAHSQVIEVKEKDKK